MFSRSTHVQESIFPEYNKVNMTEDQNLRAAKVRRFFWFKSLAIFYRFVYNEHYIILFRSLILFQWYVSYRISHLIYMDRA